MNLIIYLPVCFFLAVHTAIPSLPSEEKKSVNQKYTAHYPETGNPDSGVVNHKEKKQKNTLKQNYLTDHWGAITRGDTSKKEIALVFTGDQFFDGGNFIRQTLKKKKVKASFFLTGNFYRNPLCEKLLLNLSKDGHYLGAHSNRHLLYCDWNKRDSLLVTKQQFQHDLLENYAAMKKFGAYQTTSPFFLPPYEWYNDSIAAWTRGLGLQLINYTPGTISHADYTTPEMKNYRGSEEILASIKKIERTSRNGLNGFILLIHIGTDPARTDKLYTYLPHLLDYLEKKGYRFIKTNQLLTMTKPG